MLSAVRLANGMARTSLGGVHYATSGGSNTDLTPLFLFHMSPRSTDEFLEAMPLLSADGRLVVAIDEPGYGRSQSPCRSCSLDEIADCAIDVAAELGVEHFAAVGSLMGCFLSLSLAQRYPERVRALVLTNMYHYPPKPEAPQEEAPVDDWSLDPEGEHLTALWKRRSGFLDPELNTRAVTDELIYRLNRRRRYAEGISIQDASAYDFEAAARAARCPALCIRGEGATALFDRIGLGMSEQFAKGVGMLSDAEVAVISPGSINLINQDASVWAEHVLRFVGARG